MESLCECYHLTNFGIMFDFTGNSDPNNIFLSWFSIINMSVSTGLIILTEIILFIQNKSRWNFLICIMITWFSIYSSIKQKLNQRRLTEIHRNFWLILAQLSFISLVGQGENYLDSPYICEIFGAIIHLCWTNFWFWTGIEGYFLYSSVTVIFKQERKIKKSIYVIGYFFPMSLIVIVLSLSLQFDYGFYLR